MNYMFYLLPILIWVFILSGCKVIVHGQDQTEGCIKVHKLDSTLIFYCQGYFSDKEGIEGIGCKKLEHFLADKPVYEDMERVVIREGIIVPISCDELKE